MIELTSNERIELETRVVAKYRSALSKGNADDGGLSVQIAAIAARATILTIQEYENMKAENQGPAPTAE